MNKYFATKHSQRPLMSTSLQWPLFSVPRVAVWGGSTVGSYVSVALPFLLVNGCVSRFHQILSHICLVKGELLILRNVFPYQQLDKVILT